MSYIYNHWELTLLFVLLGINRTSEIKLLDTYLKVDTIKVILELLGNYFLIINIKLTTNQHFLERGCLQMEVKFISKKNQFTSLSLVTLSEWQCVWLQQYLIGNVEAEIIYHPEEQRRLCYT